MRVKCRAVRSHVYGSNPLEKDLLSLEEEKKPRVGLGAFPTVWLTIGVTAGDRLLACFQNKVGHKTQKPTSSVTLFSSSTSSMLRWETLNWNRVTWGRQGAASLLV